MYTYIVYYIKYRLSYTRAVHKILTPNLSFKVQFILTARLNMFVNVYIIYMFDCRCDFHLNNTTTAPNTAYIILFQLASCDFLFLKLKRTLKEHRLMTSRPLNIIGRKNLTRYQKQSSTSVQH